MIKAIVYDLDDTLYPERSFQVSGFRAVAKYLNKHNFFITAEEIDKVNQEYPGHCFDNLILKFKLPMALDELMTVYREHQPIIEPFVDVYSILDELKKKYFLGLLTDYTHTVQANKVKALKLDNYFNFIVYTDLLNAPKPDTSGFQLMINKAGCFKNEIIYIGDNESKDFIGARNMGYVTIKFSGNGFYKNVIAENDYKADYEIDNHLNLLKLLDKLNNEGV